MTDSARETTEEAGPDRGFAAGGAGRTDRLLRSLAHDIRTPLNAMIFTLRLLETKLGPHLDEQDRGDFDSLRSEIWSILELHNGILDHARLADGRLVAEESDFALDDALRDCVQVVRPLALQKGLPIVADLKAGAIVRSDPSMIRHIVGNLLSNAIRYTERGQIAVRSRVDEGGVRVEVEDTGIGIAPEDRARIFEEYFRADSGRGGGLGLGLTLAREMSELIGGSLTVTSRSGEGSTFTLALPPRALVAPTPLGTSA
jgi:signal transduction histidine kinase